MIAASLKTNKKGLVNAPKVPEIRILGIDMGVRIFGILGIAVW